jgi:type I restriction enzyme S subunit
MKQVSEVTSGTFVFKNDLLVAKITPSFENGKQAILDNLPTDYGYATTEVWAVHPKNTQQHPEYLFDYLRISEIRHDLATKMEGATGRQRLPRNVLENLLIAFPPYCEQKKIAAVLSAIQEAKEKTENVISALKEMKKSMMNHLFRYGVVPIEDISRVKLKETEIGLMPETWKVSRLGDLQVSIQTGPFGSQLHASDYIKGGIPVINPTNISEGKIIPDNDCCISPEKAHSLSRHLMKQGDIAFGRRGEMGRSAIVKDDGLFCGTGSLLVRFEDCNIDSEYISYFLRTEHVKQWLLAESIGTTMNNLNTEILGRMRIPLPTLREQVMIKSSLSSIEEKIASEANMKDALEEMFKTLLSLLMTGKVRVNHLEI